MPAPLSPLPLAGTASALLMSLLVFQGFHMNRTTPRFAPPADTPIGCVEGTGRALRLVVLGESTVAGVGAPTVRQGLPGMVADVLAQETGRSIEWRALGQNGVTAAACRRTLVPRLAGERADLVIVALGVNDTVLLRGARRWTRDVRELIDEVRRHVGRDVPIVFSAVPPLGCSPAFPQPLRSFAHVRSRLLDRGLRGLVRTLPAVYHAPLLPFRGGRAYFCADGYHPSPLGYEAWAEMMRPVVREVVYAHHLLDGVGLDEVGPASGDERSG